ITAGTLFFLRERKLTAVPAQLPPPAPAQQATPQVVPPAPAPRAPEKAFSPHQMLAQIFEDRNRGHSVTASAEGGGVPIGSPPPPPGYLVAVSARTLRA